MASNIESDGKTVTVTTDEGHRIGFAMAELNAASTSGEITTGWANGVPPASAERTVAAAKTEAEAYVAQNHPSKPDEARAAQEKEGNTIGGTLKGIADALGLARAGRLQIGRYSSGQSAARIGAATNASAIAVASGQKPQGACAVILISSCMLSSAAPSIKAWRACARLGRWLRLGRQNGDCRGLGWPWNPILQ